jgi:hypothetical protein
MSTATGGGLVLPRTRRRLAGNRIVHGICWASTARDATCSRG